MIQPRNGAAIAQFIQAIEADPALQAKLKTATNAEAIARLGQQLGYDFAVEDLQAAILQNWGGLTLEVAPFLQQSPALEASFLQQLIQALYFAS